MYLWKTLVQENAIDIHQYELPDIQHEKVMETPAKRGIALSQLSLHYI